MRDGETELPSRADEPAVVGNNLVGLDTGDGREMDRIQCPQPFGGETSRLPENSRRDLDQVTELEQPGRFLVSLGICRRDLGGASHFDDCETAGRQLWRFTDVLGQRPALRLSQHELYERRRVGVAPWSASSPRGRAQSPRSPSSGP